MLKQEIEYQNFKISNTHIIYIRRYKFQNNKHMILKDQLLFDLSAGAELVEGALGHPWEDVDHRVQPILLVPLSKGDYLEQMLNE